MQETGATATYDSSKNDFVIDTGLPADSNGNNVTMKASDVVKNGGASGILEDYKAVTTATAGVQDSYGQKGGVNFGYSNGELSVTVGNKTFDAGDVKDLGMQFSGNTQEGFNVQVRGYDQPIQVANIGNTSTFADEYKKAQNIARDTKVYNGDQGLGVNYDESTKNHFIFRIDPDDVNAIVDAIITD